ncbi:hypothetical protein UVI_02015000 [Ustilaginoidea virens]|nr:hypothetical protein UVI_02015000 [Ustilaginoidea virens]
MQPDTRQEIGGLLKELYSSPTKALLIFAPAGIIAGLLQQPAVTVFLLNLMALVPLPGLILYSVLVATGDSALLGGLLGAVLGNATEIALGICALFLNETRIAQGIMIGSILTYCLFVLGGSFLVASYGKKEKTFSKARTSIMSSLVMSASICLAIPTVMALAGQENKARSHSLPDHHLFLSRATSVVQMLLFLAYLVFRFQTHRRIFPRNSGSPREASGTSRSCSSRAHLLRTSLAALFCTFASSYYLVSRLSVASKTLAIPESFAAMVVLPQAGSLTKAVTIARHTRSDASPLPEQISRLDFAIRSIMTNVFDTELFILPMLVMLGWAVGVPMRLSFGLFETVIFLLAILIMTYLVQHGKTTYFEGIMLMGTYLTIATALYLRPEGASSPSSGMTTP